VLRLCAQRACRSVKSSSSGARLVTACREGLPLLREQPALPPGVGQHLRAAAYGEVTARCRQVLGSPSPFIKQLDLELTTILFLFP